LSLVRPDRISSPITRMPAVTISLIVAPTRAACYVVFGRNRVLGQDLDVGSDFAAEMSSRKLFFRQPARCPRQMIGINPYRAGVTLATIL
jgi:hypothetical protein